MLLNQALYISAPAQRTAPANAADHCFVDIFLDSKEEIIQLMNANDAQEEEQP